MTAQPPATRCRAHCCNTAGGACPAPALCNAAQRLRHNRTQEHTKQLEQGVWTPSKLGLLTCASATDRPTICARCSSTAHCSGLSPSAPANTSADSNNQGVGEGLGWAGAVLEAGCRAQRRQLVSSTFATHNPTTRLPKRDTAPPQPSPPPSAAPRNPHLETPQ